MKENETNSGHEIAVHKNTDLPLTPVDLNNSELPDLENAEVLPLDLNSDYWTPTSEGEIKKVFFDTIKISPVVDMNNKDVQIDLPCAFFYEKTNGEVRTIRNGSKRLIAILENHRIERGTPLQIEYLGKIRNSTNSYMSDNWSVKPLLIKV